MHRSNDMSFSWKDWAELQYTKAFSTKGAYLFWGKILVWKYGRPKSLQAVKTFVGRKENMPEDGARFIWLS